MSEKKYSANPSTRILLGKTEETECEIKIA